SFSRCYSEFAGQGAGFQSPEDSPVVYTASASSGAYPSFYYARFNRQAAV
ncbi:hypothetical protein FoTM2_010766, partial [Fusarium oxysporum f. sp. vasinfectum]